MTTAADSAGLIWEKKLNTKPCDMRRARMTRCVQMQYKCQHQLPNPLERFLAPSFT